MDVAALIREGIEDRTFPGAAWALPNGEVGFAGHFTYDPDSPPVKADTYWDLASLTKVLVTTSLAMRSGLDLDAPLPEGYSVRNLLLHNSGLGPFRRYAPSTDILEAIKAEPLLDAPGTTTRYSDLGFLRLQSVLEDEGLAIEDQFAAFETGLTFRPPASLCAPTALELQGVVHDPTARQLGRAAGHAGLFGQLRHVSDFMKRLKSGEIAPLDRVQEWTRRQHSESTRGLGWDTVLTLDDRVIESAWGHTGFTGTSIWTVGDQTAILLTNRVFPTDDNPKIIAFRRRFHSMVL